MKFLFAALLFLSYSPFLFSQAISIHSPSSQQSYDRDTFSAGDQTVRIIGNRFVLGTAEIVNPVAWSFSSTKQKAAFLQRSNGMNLVSYNSKGSKLIDMNLEFFSPSDNTINTYQFNNGRIVLRDNVANFSFMEATGDQAFAVSNSSGSMEGERESELASNPSGNTIVLYNPIISYGDQTGSRAQIVYGDRDTNIFFTSRTDEIRNVRVSSDGSFIILLTDGPNGANAIVFDRFGNELFRRNSDEDLVGATLHEDAGHLTIYSSSRVQVYEIPGGDRLGSASSRSSILYAGYDPESQTIIALGGALRGIDIQDPEITAVSISRREIARQSVPFGISTLDKDRLDISVTGSNLYVISGLNRKLLIDVSF